MTPGARLQAAIDILKDIDSSQTAADAIIRAYFRPRRYAGSKDRRAVTERVFNIIRHRARLDWWIAGAAGDIQPSARLRVVASLFIQDAETPDSVTSLFDGEGHSPSPLTPEEQHLADNLAGKPLHHDAMPPGVRFETPEWMDDLLRQQWGDDFANQMAGLNSPAPVDLRVNGSRVTREQARKSLSVDHIKTELTPHSPLGLRLMERARLEETKAFKKGLVEVQDEGSQLVALLCQAKPGMTVIDYCAGAGGKTLALADAMGLQDSAQKKGRLVACDISTKRMSGMEDRLKRGGVGGVKQLVIGGTEIEALKGQADRVLCDVPCSGVGAWRRHPEARWRLTAARLDEHLKEQQNVLEKAAQLVKSGGRLIYATCSLLEQENQRQIERFLADHADYKALSMKDVWSEITASPCPPAEHGLLLSPAITGTDGFFCAALEKHGSISEFDRQNRWF